ncbi:hypothetical protein KKG83_07335 [Candidatus Micrarchaeota archaeon]|nr:hypothetical protein [Candidatus Micrarchaeota archaeon]MBU2477255.1 hypothetical protein [Candidatus Micrarchaeota archaeon]
MSLDKVIACLKGIGLKPNVDDFQNRLVIQKAIYLLKLKGIDPGFAYNLYVRGPYSPDLTKEVYGHKSTVEKLETSSRLDNSESKKVEEFKDIFSELKPSILEVAATYSYFAFEQKQDPITALQNVKRMKTFYSEAQIAVGVSKAKEFLFRPSEKQLADMKEEARAWQDASLKSMRANSHEKKRGLDM